MLPSIINNVQIRSEQYIIVWIDLISRMNRYE